MNHAELVALVAEREQKKQSWTTIPTEDLKELLQGYNKSYGVPWPQSEMSMEST